MQFTHICIKNFRNFANLSIDLNNKNVIFGLNDVGKTNFLSAIRCIFDYKFRNNITENDFFQKDINNTIDILLSIEINDSTDDDAFLRTNLHGALKDNQNNPTIIKLRLKVSWDSSQQDVYSELFWGNNDDIELLTEIPNKGLYKTKLDDIFFTIHFDALTDGVKDFQANKKELIHMFNEDDSNLSTNLKTKADEINALLSNSSIVKELQEQLTNEYSSLRDEHSTIILQSEQSIGRLSSGLKPYVQLENNGNLYPSSGDGRKKILSYAIRNTLAKKSDTHKINVYLFEEPENSLHKSLQRSLSRKIFNPDDSETYKYFFLTTHSSEIVSEMDDTMLIRLGMNQYNSYIFKVPKEYKNLSKMYSDRMAEAIFYNRVLLVEGPSEKLLFETILQSQNIYIEEAGGFILSIRGIAFKPYFELFEKLGISIFVRTDNDLKPNEDNQLTYSFPGMKRLSNLFTIKNNTKLSNINIWNNPLNFKEPKTLIEIKNAIYACPDRQLLAENNLFLSQIDLENDMLAKAGNQIITDLTAYEETSTLDSHSKVIAWLQNSKQKNMVTFLTAMSDETALLLYQNLDGLKEFVDG